MVSQFATIIANRIQAARRTAPPGRLFFPRRRLRARSYLCAVRALPTTNHYPNHIPMQIAVPREIAAGERRVALTPDVIPQLAGAGHTILFERGAGDAAGF